MNSGEARLHGLKFSPLPPASTPSTSAGIGLSAELFDILLYIYLLYQPQTFGMYIRFFILSTSFCNTKGT